MLSFLRKPATEATTSSPSPASPSSGAAMATTTTTTSDPLIPKITSATTPAANPAAPLRSTFSVLAAAGEPVATVRVRNLQAVIPCGRDAWGRPGKVQPVLLSSELSFRSPFSASSADDRLVDSETAHYGNLSKTLLGGLESLGGPGSTITTTTTEPSQEPSSPSSSAVFELLWVRLTGRVPDGSTVALPPDQVPFLDARTLRSLSLTINLPKASLLGGGGVSLTTTAAFKAKSALIPGGANDDNGNNDDEDQVKNPIDAYARTLRISGLHVPTLVGVNANEREARQMLVAEVEIDRFDVTGEDVHDQIERVIVDAMEKSSFETLEALGTHIATRILDDFRLDRDLGQQPQPQQQQQQQQQQQDGNGANQSMRDRGWQVRVTLEKPIAVPFAECPAVEVRMGRGL